MRPQRRLHTTGKRLSRRKVVFCTVVVGFVLMVLLLGLFSPRTTSAESPRSSAQTLLDPKSWSWVKNISTTQPPQTRDLSPAGSHILRSGPAAKLLRQQIQSHTGSPVVRWMSPVNDITVYATPLDIVAITNDESMAALFPRITFRDRTASTVARSGGDLFSQWEGLTMPEVPLQIPSWASVEESTVLTQASIFVSLASYRDPECADTLTALFDHAMSPHRIYVGVSEERPAGDPDCLRFLDGRPDLEVAKQLWGPGAADESVYTKQVFWRRDMHWSDLVGGIAPVSIMTTTDALAAAAENQLNPDNPPQPLFLLPGYEQETLTCVGGELERARDAFVLHNAMGVRRADSKWLRRGKGGAQQRPSAALAGCRVMRRLTSPTTARGPTYGRYVTSLLYMDQDYFMVIDSHSRFSVDWDAKMIRRVFQNPTPGILSHYPNGYTPEKPEAEFKKTDVMIMCRGQVLANAMPKLGAMWMPVRPYNVLQAFAAAGYMFGDAQFALDVPFDPFLPYLFDGEEILYSGRVWTMGWDIYGPGEPNIFHHYGRPKTPKFWENVKGEQQALKAQSERRALFLLRRPQPWVQIVEDAQRQYNLSRPVPDRDSSVTFPPFSPPPYVPGEQRPVVTDKMAAEKPALSILRGYYGTGSVRTLTAYWAYCQMDDDKVVERDNEHRWMSGNGLCDEALRKRS